MQYSNQAKKQLKNILYNVFPDIDEYPINSMTPALVETDKGIKVYMLIYAEDCYIEDFSAEKDSVGVKTTARTEDNKIMGKDLILRFDFNYSTGNPYFETIIYGINPTSQQAFIEALQQTEDITLWVVNQNKEIIKVMSIEWDYDLVKDVVDEMLYN